MSTPTSSDPPPHTPEVRPHHARSKTLTWDDDTIALHDLDRGTRMKIDEPDTPFATYTAAPEDLEASVVGGGSALTAGQALDAVLAPAADKLLGTLNPPRSPTAEEQEIANAEDRRYAERLSGKSSSSGGGASGSEDDDSSAGNEYYGKAKKEGGPAHNVIRGTSDAVAVEDLMGKLKDVAKRRGTLDYDDDDHSDDAGADAEEDGKEDGKSSDGKSEDGARVPEGKMQDSADGGDGGDDDEEKEVEAAVDPLFDKKRAKHYNEYEMLKKWREEQAKLGDDDDDE